MPLKPPPLPPPRTSPPGPKPAPRPPAAAPLLVPPVDVAQPGRRAWEREVPSWLLSLGVHLVAMIALALSFHSVARRPASPLWSAQGVMVSDSDQANRGYDDLDPGALAAPTAVPLATELALSEALEIRSPVDPTNALPQAAESMIGARGLEGAGIGHAGSSGDGPGAGPGRGIGDGKGRTRIYGVEGEGTRFVYVFDRSASMEGAGSSPLAAAKAELLASIEGLDPMHQFQIIFYNERPWVFNPTGDPGRLPFATVQNKAQAKKWVLSITADGGTRHEEALSAAIRLRPDCIFFLTDADEPRLSDAQLQKIQRMARGISINTIEFGVGPKSGPPSFLARLAEQNEGNYAYVDITRLGAGR